MSNANLRITYFKVISYLDTKIRTKDFEKSHFIHFYQDGGRGGLIGSDDSPQTHTRPETSPGNASTVQDQNPSAPPVDSAVMSSCLCRSGVLVVYRLVRCKMDLAPLLQ